ncbi:MAG: hypothetical protein BWX80_03848 [Candidatus Hydrogenedentes bacterium ADurb.Bin101]|nr:MAG: hypothetical protein BWX80_03848 [Candidatus Hydrogenedentes bacterium ADurb.Bin101]
MDMYLRCHVKGVQQEGRKKVAQRRQYKDETIYGGEQGRMKDLTDGGAVLLAGIPGDQHIHALKNRNDKYHNNHEHLPRDADGAVGGIVRRTDIVADKHMVDKPMGAVHQVQSNQRPG